MNAEVTLYFRDQLRQARAIALRDSEAFEESIFVLERLGSYLMGKKGSLAKYEQHLINQAKKSLLAEEIPNEQRDFHTPFPILYNSVREARNMERLPTYSSICFETIVRDTDSLRSPIKDLCCKLDIVRVVHECAKIF